jgi:L-glyceraldehyde 3-phosphate reductase
MDYKADDSRYEKIQYNRCGRSGLLLPKISLGLWHNFGGVDPFDVCQQMLFRAFDLGITHFDLANNYGPPPGSAEQTLGKILKEDLGTYRDELVISTKAGYLMWPGPYGEWGSRKYVLASLDQSLKRLGLDYVDIFYSHRPDPNTPLEETMSALAQAVKQGKAIYVGLSNYSPEQTTLAAQILRDMDTPCLIHQPRYSMYNRQIEDGLLDVLEAKGIGCIPFCPLAQGMLTDKYLNGIPKGSRGAKPHGFLKPEQITQDILAKTAKLNVLAKTRGQSLAQMALAWVLRDERITSALIGASSVEQIEQNVAALDNLEFAEDQLGEIETILNK